MSKYFNLYFSENYLEKKYLRDAQLLNSQYYRVNEDLLSITFKKNNNKAVPQSTGIVVFTFCLILSQREHWNGHSWSGCARNFCQSPSSWIQRTIALKEVSKSSSALPPT